MKDNKEQSDKIRYILESCHINFLIGSGASRDYLNTLSNIEKLLNEIEEKPDFKEKSFIESSVKYSYFKGCIRGSLGLFDKKIAAEKKKEFKDTQENYIKFILSLNTILLRRKSSIIGKQINLFTTNMDLFLDCALESNNIEFNDGFSGRINPKFSTSNFKKTIFQNSPHYDNQSELPTFNLYKLHGSVNWKLDEQNKSIVYDGSLKTLLDIEDIKIDNSNVLEFNDKESLDDLIKKAKDKICGKQLDAFLRTYNSLVMVNPTKDKHRLTTIDYNYYEQLRMFSNALEKENSVLFVTGFSFADDHIREITQRVAKGNPTLIVYIFCFDATEKQKIEKLFSDKYKNVICIENFKLSDIINKIFDPVAREFDDNYFGKNELEKVIIIEQSKQETEKK